MLHKNETLKKKKKKKKQEKIRHTATLQVYATPLQFMYQLVMKLDHEKAH